MRASRSKGTNRMKSLIYFVIGIGLIGGVSFMLLGLAQAKAENKPESAKVDEPNETNTSESEIIEENPYTEIQIAAAGDIMFHDTQLKSGYDEGSNSYDFKSVFEDVKNIISTADLAIANFETTTAGDAQPYTGYPVFNSPDEVIDAIQHAGFDVLTTANNHSLDTGSKGLKRTVEVINTKGLETVGTYSKKPESRILIKEVKGIKIAILSYTEMINSVGTQYAPDELNDMINMMDKDKVIQDIQEAKDSGADLIMAFMHWGNEYEENPSEKQIEYAELMAQEGVNIILGSHPHVIQKSEYIEVGEQKSFVIYSMGNFISNQRMETLSSKNELTEDGVIVKFDIRKNNETNETTIEQVNYVPTWVYRNMEEGQSKFTYRILPIENFLNSSEIIDEFKPRMQRSMDETVAKMEGTPF
ncbi:CapA family protein [Robertmurraya massiliosenegalensis]|uniref:CapA family protein n=1 Tax=Robertmurraya massiliosenegalensis TaxID=1287657 RepID=UPI0003120C8D|nr:CapA family protein [Robertmurraya massiliosenegalensis]